MSASPSPQKRPQVLIVGATKCAVNMARALTLAGYMVTVYSPGDATEHRSRVKSFLRMNCSVHVGTAASGCPGVRRFSMVFLADPDLRRNGKVAKAEQEETLMHVHEFAVLLEHTSNSDPEIGAYVDRALDDWREMTTPQHTPIEVIADVEEQQSPTDGVHRQSSVEPAGG